MRGERFYTMESTDRERRRLVRQAERHEPNTVRLLTAAGLKAGGHGARPRNERGRRRLHRGGMVGSQGAVTGLDWDPAQVEFARTRARRLGVGNVAFTVAKVGDFKSENLFDAVVGREILIHTPDLPEALERTAQLVRPGGVLAFHEYHFHLGWRPRIHPAALMDDRDLLRGFSLVTEVLEQVGGNPEIGVLLPALLARYGEPTAAVTTPVIVGRAGVDDAMEFLIESARSLTPASVRLGLLAEGELDLDGAQRRFRTRLAALGDAEPAMETPPELMTWVRKRG